MRTAFPSHFILLGLITIIGQIFGEEYKSEVLYYVIFSIILLHQLSEHFALILRD